MPRTWAREMSRIATYSYGPAVLGGCPVPKQTYASEAFLAGGAILEGRPLDDFSWAPLRHFKQNWQFRIVLVERGELPGGGADHLPAIDRRGKRLDDAVRGVAAQGPVSFARFPQKWIALKRAPVIRDCFVAPARVLPHAAPDAVGFRIVRVQLDGLAEIRFGAFDIVCASGG